MQDTAINEAHAPEPAAERRRNIRVPLETNVGVVSESNFYAGFSQDVSEGGLFVATYQLLPVGTEVCVSFAVGDVEIEAHGTVRWLREPLSGDVSPGMGIEFEGLPREQEDAIRAFVRLREPLFFDL